MYICNTYEKYNKIKDYSTKRNAGFYIYAVFNIKHKQ